MRVLRVQNEEGVGPYFCNRRDKHPDVIDMQDAHNADFAENPKVYPPTSTDHGICRQMQKRERCGFINEAQLNNWFSEQELTMLKKHGFHVTTLNVNITALGKHQILFQEPLSKQEKQTQNMVAVTLEIDCIKHSLYK